MMLEKYSTGALERDVCTIEPMPAWLKHIHQVPVGHGWPIEVPGRLPDESAPVRFLFSEKRMVSVVFTYS